MARYHAALGEARRGFENLGPLRVPRGGEARRRLRPKRVDSSPTYASPIVQSAFYVHLFLRLLEVELRLCLDIGLRAASVAEFIEHRLGRTALHEPL
jgi:hypothetical protein